MKCSQDNLENCLLQLNIDDEIQQKKNKVETS